MNVQGDEPLMPESADRSGRGAAGGAPRRRHRDPGGAARVGRGAAGSQRGQGGDATAQQRALYFSRAPIPWERDGALRPGRPVPRAARRHLGHLRLSRRRRCCAWRRCRRARSSRSSSSSSCARWRTAWISALPMRECTARRRRQHGRRCAGGRGAAGDGAVAAVARRPGRLAARLPRAQEPDAGLIHHGPRAAYSVAPRPCRRCRLGAGAAAGSAKDAPRLGARLAGAACSAALSRCRACSRRRAACHGRSLARRVARSAPSFVAAGRHGAMTGSSRMIGIPVGGACRRSSVAAALGREPSPDRPPAAPAASAAAARAPLAARPLRWPPLPGRLGPRWHLGRTAVGARGCPRDALVAALSAARAAARSRRGSRGAPFRASRAAAHRVAGRPLPLAAPASSRPRSRRRPRAVGRVADRRGRAPLAPSGSRRALAAVGRAPASYGSRRAPRRLGGSAAAGRCRAAVGAEPAFDALPEPSLRAGAGAGAGALAPGAAHAGSVTSGAAVFGSSAATAGCSAGGFFSRSVGSAAAGATGIW